MQPDEPLVEDEDDDDDESDDNEEEDAEGQCTVKMVNLNLIC